MASKAQIAANRRNAEKSTGPQSARGKAAIGRNALSHGLTAARIICFDESEADFAAFAEGLRAALDPADPVEAQLAERIALCAWRLRRAYRVEAELFNAFRKTQPQFHDTEIGTVFDCATMQMAALARYETALDRALSQAQRLLERYQARRRAAVENYETKPIFPAESEAGAEAKPIPPRPPSQSRDAAPEI
ncbi:MAG TPA: hypothetical protein VN766_09840 [Stellaceae bacterium]|nr:hypothetical protein [Stellaceae bacterium]